jgi:hypothetical protein
MESLEEEKRGFGGWWIPFEIAEITGFHIYQMFLWAEIHAFSMNGNKCFIKNETFAKRFGVNNNTITKSITALKAKNLVTQIGFDGRRRYLVANNPPSMNTTQKDKQTHTKRRGTAKRVAASPQKEVAASPQKESINIKDKVKINMEDSLKESFYKDLSKFCKKEELSEEGKKERMNLIQEELLNSKEWHKRVIRRFEIGQQSVEFNLKKFCNDIWAKDDFYKPIDKIKNHFLNWLANKIEKKA